MKGEYGDLGIGVAVTATAVGMSPSVLSAASRDNCAADEFAHRVPFDRVVRRRIDDYFQAHDLSSKAGPAMQVKIFLGLAVWAAGFVCLYAPALPWWRLPVAYLLLAIAQTFVVLNVAHDGIHGAISHRSGLNRFFSYMYDCCGVSSYLIRILHNQGHHYTINLFGEDDPLEGRHVFRFTRSAARKPFHRFQHLYAPLLYALFSLDYVFVRDFEDLFFPSQTCLKGRPHPFLERLSLVVCKLLYLNCLVLLPIFYLHYSAVSVVLGFLGMHFLIGFAVAIVFAPTHILACNEFPGSSSEYEDFVHHILATTADFAVESRVVTWLVGGLNHHIVHHICPQVCHTHYMRLTRIVRQTAAEFQVPYKHHPTMTAAVRAHLSFLKQLGVARESKI